MSPWEPMVTLFDFPGCPNDRGIAPCAECSRRIQRARMAQRRRIRRRLRRAKRRRQVKAS